MEDDEFLTSAAERAHHANVIRNREHKEMRDKMLSVELTKIDTMRQILKALENQNENLFDLSQNAKEIEKGVRSIEQRLYKFEKGVR